MHVKEDGWFNSNKVYVVVFFNDDLFQNRPFQNSIWPKKHYIHLQWNGVGVSVTIAEGFC